LLLEAVTEKPKTPTLNTKFRGDPCVMLWNRPTIQAKKVLDLLYALAALLFIYCALLVSLYLLRASVSLCTHSHW
jgi:hypothetical protein